MLMFEMYDMGGDGVITKAELSTMLHSVYAVPTALLSEGKAAGRNMCSVCVRDRKCVCVYVSVCVCV
jgi:hypothetical protein